MECSRISRSASATPRRYSPLSITVTQRKWWRPRVAWSERSASAGADSNGTWIAWALRRSETPTLMWSSSWETKAVAER